MSWKGRVHHHNHHHLHHHLPSPRFDLREFHRTVLECLGPLSVVERCVEGLVAGEQRGEEGGRVPEPEVASGGGRVHLSLLLSLFLWARW